MTVLNDVMPEWHWCETYGRRFPAPAETSLEAMLGVRAADMPFTRRLMALRDLPSRIIKRSPRFDGPRPDSPLIDAMLAFGFCRLGEVPGREFTFGLIDQSWRLDGGERIAVEDPVGFIAFDRPGFVKIAANFAATPLGDGAFVSTQTRILATDDRTRRVFGAYWLFIRPFSGTTRKDWLRAGERCLGA